MPTFALIAEGKTDQVILEYIVQEICGEMFEEVTVNRIQPLRDATDASRAPHGGWELVLECCKTRMRETLAVNDFVVVQIDTDCGDHKNFGLGLTEGGVDKHYTKLVSETSAIIIDHIGDETYGPHKDNIIFAVAVHSIESWILLCLFDIDKQKKSFPRLEKELGRAGQGKLEKTNQCYSKLARAMKRKKLLAVSRYGTSLDIFVARLQSLKFDESSDDTDE